MIGIVVALVTLVALIMYITGWWRPKWIRQEQIPETPERTAIAEALDRQCALLNSLTPEKERIRHVVDAA